MRTRNWAVLAVAVLVAAGWLLLRVKPAAAPTVVTSVEPRVPTKTQPTADADGPKRIDRARWEQLHRRVEAAKQRKGISDAGVAALKRRIPRGYIGARLKEIRPLINECHELASANGKELVGNVDVQFSIVGVPDAGAIMEEPIIGEESTLRNKALEECIRATVTTLEFPDPGPDNAVTVNLGFAFTTEDAKKDKTP